MRTTHAPPFLSRSGKLESNAPPLYNTNGGFHGNLKWRRSLRRYPAGSGHQRAGIRSRPAWLTRGELRAWPQKPSRGGLGIPETCRQRRSGTRRGAAISARAGGSGNNRANGRLRPLMDETPAPMVAVGAGRVDELEGARCVPGFGGPCGGGRRLRRKRTGGLLRAMDGRHWLGYPADWAAGVS
jgi:hypothetical protein